MLLNAGSNRNSWELPHDLHSGDQYIFLEVWAVEVENMFVSLPAAQNGPKGHDYIMVKKGTARAPSFVHCLHTYVLQAESI